MGCARSSQARTSAGPAEPPRELIPDLLVFRRLGFSLTSLLNCHARPTKCTPWLHGSLTVASGPGLCAVTPPPALRTAQNAPLPAVSVDIRVKLAGAGAVE